MPLSPEHKQKMIEGRRRARLARQQIEQAGPQIRKAMHVNELAGITNDDCCIECTQERCVISDKSYCAHPRKCGLAPADKVNPKAMERYNRARKTLIHAEVDRQS